VKSEKRKNNLSWHDSFGVNREGRLAAGSRWAWITDQNDLGRETAMAGSIKKQIVQYGAVKSDFSR